MNRLAAILLIWSAAASAQVSVSGLAYDSLHARPLAGAFVAVIGLKVTAVSDSAGRFVLQNVPKGTYRIAMQHDVLDAIGLSGTAGSLVVTGTADSVVVAVPSFGALWRAACSQPVPTDPNVGFIFGNVSRGGRLIPGAAILAQRVDSTAADGTSMDLQPSGAESDASGSYALCGVPISTRLRIRANAGNSYGTWIGIAPLSPERLVRRDLQLVTVSPMRFDVPRRMTLTGRVTTDSPRSPLQGAEVSIADVGMSTLTNASGGFRMANVPVGVHTLQIRKLGFSVVDGPVVLDHDLDTTLTMVSMTTLDSVRVTAAEYSPNDEAMRLFEEHRKVGLGKFFTRQELETFKDRRMGDILGQLPGTKAITGSGGQAWLMPNRGPKTIAIGPGGASSVCDPPKQDSPDAPRGIHTCRNACFPHVFVDGVDISPTEVPNINRLSPFQIEAIEYYAGAAQVPAEYNRLNAAGCGVVVIHTRRGK